MKNIYIIISLVCSLHVVEKQDHKKNERHIVVNGELAKSYVKCQVLMLTICFSKGKYLPRYNLLCLCYGVFLCVTLPILAC